MFCIWNIPSYMALFESGASLNPPVNDHFPYRNCPFESFLQYSSFSDRPKMDSAFRLNPELGEQSAGNEHKGHVNQSLGTIHGGFFSCFIGARSSRSSSWG